MKKIFAGLLIAASMLVSVVAMAADNFTLPSTTDVQINNPRGAYAWFIDGNHSYGLPEVGAGDEIQYNIDAAGRYATKANLVDDAAKAAGAGVPVDASLIGFQMNIIADNPKGLGNDGGHAEDTAFLAYGTNSDDTWINFSLGLDAAVQNIAGDMEAEDFGMWTITFDGGSSNQNVPIDITTGTPVPMRFAGNAASVNHDMISPVTLKVSDIGVEAAKGTWDAHLTATIVVGALNY